MGILVGMSCMTIFRFCIYLQTRITSLHQKYHDRRILNRRHKLNQKIVDMVKRNRVKSNTKNKNDKVNNVNECGKKMDHHSKKTLKL